MAAVESKIANCETIIGYTFSNKRLLHEALQTSGVGAVPKNTRLAVYGNMALNKELCHLWWTMDLDKGKTALFSLLNIVFAKAHTIARKLDGDQKHCPEFGS